MPTRTLTDLELRMLEFAETHPRVMGRGSIFEDVRDEFGWRPITYYQRLFTLLDDPAALVANPLLVNRLNRIRAERVAARGSRSFLRTG